MSKTNAENELKEMKKKETNKWKNDHEFFHGLALIILAAGAMLGLAAMDVHAGAGLLGFVGGGFALLGITISMDIVKKLLKKW